MHARRVDESVENCRLAAAERVLGEPAAQIQADIQH